MMYTSSTPEVMAAMQYERDLAARKQVLVKEARDACRQAAAATQPPRWKRHDMRTSLGRIFAHGQA